MFLVKYSYYLNFTYENERERERMHYIFFLVAKYEKQEPISGVNKSVLCVIPEFGNNT